MQIIKIIAIVAADIMERQDNWTDNGERKAGKKNDREA